MFIIPALIAPVPLDTDAQGFGYLALTARLGGGFDTLAPFHPEIHYLYSPGFPALIAYLSHQLGLGIQMIEMGVGGGARRCCSSGWRMTSAPSWRTSGSVARWRSP